MVLQQINVMQLTKNTWTIELAKIQKMLYKYKFVKHIQKNEAE